MSPTHQTRPHILNTRTCPQGHVLVFPLPLPRFEHQKVPMWALSGARAPHLSPLCLEHQNVPARAHSGARAPPLSLSLVSNTRTSLCVARSGAHTPPLFLSLVSSIRTSPHGLILMFRHPSPSRPPERAHMGSFWCSRTSPLPLPRLEHQNEPTWARSGAHAPPLSLSFISNLPSSSPSSIYLFSLFLY